MTDAAFIRSLPKVEMHIHIEGTLEPEMMFDLAARNHVRLPYRSVDDVRAAYEFADLQSFLDLLYRGATALRTVRDFDDLTSAYLRRAAADGVRHAEIFFDPQVHTERGVGFPVFMQGFAAARTRAEQEFGVASSLIMCFLRHLRGEAATATFEEAKPYLDQIVGVGLDSSEVGYPPSDFRQVFESARNVGLRAVAHAGEEGPPAYVWEAIDVLGVERIDHGVRAEEDAALVARIVADGITLTMCPLSNVRLRVFDRIEDHNLARLLDRGVKATINSDDPAYFGGYVADDYAAVASGLDLDRDELVTLARSSVEASFLPLDAKGQLINEIAAVA
ncbi:MAG: adenosine deaminase [Chloroflexi bacterium]|nr:adenosine deaminase [Chloroflexota bacterium]